MFDSFIIGGFECGLVYRGQHDLLHSTLHTPQTKMRQHYEALAHVGIRTARDGLPPGHFVSDRLAVAKVNGMQVIWDVSHYHYRDIGRNAANIGLIANGYHGPEEEFWICPMNEPQFAPTITGDSYGEVIKEGFLNAENIERRFKGKLRILTSNAVADGFQIDDPFASIADVIGVNVYPHLLRRPISEVLIETHQRYGRPVMISETSWHDYRDVPAFFGARNKLEWFFYVLEQVSLARQAGAEIVGLCWYPIVDCPPWEDPSGARWSHGLIKADLSFDPSLYSAMKQYNEATAK